MKNPIFLLLSLALLSLSACKKDPPPLELERFDVRWYDDDNSGTQTLGDALAFDFAVNTTDSDPDDQYIVEWDVSYFVNDNFSGILQGKENTSINTLLFTAEVQIGNLPLPGPGTLEKGDAIEFRLWCIDNYGTQVEQSHRYVIEE